MKKKKIFHENAYELNQKQHFDAAIHSLEASKPIK